MHGTQVNSVSIQSDPMDWLELALAVLHLGLEAEQDGGVHLADA